MDIEHCGHWGFRVLWSLSAVGHITECCGSVSPAGHRRLWLNEPCGSQTAVGHRLLWITDRVGSMSRVGDPQTAVGHRLLWVTERCPPGAPTAAATVNMALPPPTPRPQGGAAGVQSVLAPPGGRGGLAPAAGRNQRAKQRGGGSAHRTRLRPLPSVRPPRVYARLSPPPRFTLVQSCHGPAPPGAPAPVGAGGASRRLPCPGLTARAAPRAPPLERHVTVRHGTSRRVRQLSARPEVMRWRQSRWAPRR